LFFQNSIEKILQVKARIIIRIGKDHCMKYSAIMPIAKLMVMVSKGNFNTFNPSNFGRSIRFK